MDSLQKVDGATMETFSFCHFIGIWEDLIWTTYYCGILVKLSRHVLLISILILTPFYNCLHVWALF